MKKYNKKIIYVIFAMLVLLTACGKAEEDKKVIAKKEDVVKEQETEKPVEPSNTTQTSQEMPQEEKDEPTTQAAQKPTSQISQKPTTGTTSQKPQTPSSETPAKTPIKRVREEEKTGVTPYKHGITKYEIHLKEYMLYSDGSKELLNVSTSTYYDATNYCATDSQLKEEADANATKYMNYYQEVLRLVNEIRAQAGVSPLTLDTTLCKAASMRALEMDYNNELSHTRPSGKDCFSVLDFLMYLAVHLLKILRLVM